MIDAFKFIKNTLPPAFEYFNQFEGFINYQHEVKYRGFPLMMLGKTDFIYKNVIYDLKCVDQYKLAADSIFALFKACIKKGQLNLEIMKNLIIPNFSILNSMWKKEEIETAIKFWKLA